MIISEEYYKKNMKIELTGCEIDVLIDALNNQSHSCFEFFNYDKIIAKLKENKWKNKQ